jgi:5-methylcytosine-specific restriction endonuclease McrA
VVASQQKYYQDNQIKLVQQKRDYRSSNPEKVRESNKKHYHANKEKYAVQNKVYRKDNQETISKTRRLNYIANKEQILSERKKYYSSNRDRCLRVSSGYRKNNKEKYAHKQRIYSATRRARVRGAFVASVNHLDVFERDGYICQLCGSGVLPFAPVSHPLSPVIDHIIPLAKGGTHEPTNVQTAHLGCNASKGGRDTISEGYDVTYRGGAL